MNARRALVALATILFLAILVACGGSNSKITTSTTSMGNVTTTISDPSTCTSPQGPYSHVYVTITDVQASTNANAGDGDSSFLDLTPSLKSAPVQVDLLGTATSQCFLATLGATTQIPPGSYQQFRVILLDNSASKPSGNKCGNDANCVVLGSDSSVHTLQLSSESKTGIKIPSGQIAGGQFTVGASDNKTINIDFDACASIVVQGNGQYRLKPVLHAGEISTTTTAITGKLVDSITKAAIAGGKSVVVLEQKDSAGVDRMIMQTVPDATGSFTFCPVPAGTYDVVAVAVNGAGVAYAASITTGVQPGSALGGVFLSAETGTNTGPGSITGQVTTVKGAAGTVADISLSALQVVGTSTFTIPLAQQSSATASISTASGASCPVNTDCANYTLSLPAANPTVGAFNASGTTWAPVSITFAYTVSGHAFVPSSGGTDDCTPAVVSTPSPITITAGGSVAAPVLAFTGCQ